MQTFITADHVAPFLPKGEDPCVKYTGICHASDGLNTQLDYRGIDSVALWEDQCCKNDVLWGKLFLANTGHMVAYYTRAEGLVTIVD